LFDPLTHDVYTCRQGAPLIDLLRRDISEAVRDLAEGTVDSR